jgi:amino acid transporter
MSRLGTFAGVFTPSLLTILGIVLFLRMGFVVGSVGLSRALLILAVAHAISIVTSISVAAMATNLRVKGGGDYYLISRTLGLNYGGAIGGVLFIAQSVAVGFYCIGFSEAMAALLPDAGQFARQPIAVLAVLAMFYLSWKGSDWATRFQYGVMGMLVLALGTFAWGALPVWTTEQLSANLSAPAQAIPFWVAFAVFFPAVTGFTQGISMSGDLRDPGRSIPLGTFGAVLVSLAVYLAAAVIFAGAQPNEELASDGMAMKRLSAMPLLFNMGVIAATLSSALASFLGAPRILQAMAQDNVLPGLQIFTGGSEADGNPRRAVLLTAMIALSVVAIGNLNVVAAVVSMFFLLSYGLLNYATYVEGRAASPSFRPRFRFFNHNVSLVGALGCVTVMMAIDVNASLAAAILVFAMFHYIRRRAVPTQWADSQRSYHLHAVRDHLLAAAQEPDHPRNWRPQILVFSDDPLRRARLLRFADWVGGGISLISVVRVLERQGPEALLERSKTMAELSQELERMESTAFPLVVAAPRLDEAISTVIQSAGIGPARANTVVVNWIRESSILHPFATGRFGQNLRTAFSLGCNLLLLDADAHEWETLERVKSSDRRVDIWWSDHVTGELMLLLAHLMTRATEWESATMRVVAAPSERKPAKELRDEIESQLKTVRIEADVHVVAADNIDSLVAASTDASLVFVPFGLHDGRFFHAYGGDIAPLLDRLPIVVMAMAAQDVDLSAELEQNEEVVEAEAAPSGSGQVVKKPGINVPE